MKLRTVIFCAAALVLSACSEGDGGVIGTGSGGPANVPPIDDVDIAISGAAQKGPFIIGSEVLMSQLQANGTPSSNTSLTEISDNLGNFKSYVKKTGPVLITADGYHFNEITGKLSQGRLLLKAVYNATSKVEQHAFINILTHLAYKRTLKLLHDGMTVADAIAQAESEVVNAFMPVLPVSGVTDFTTLNIYNVDERLSNGNAYALALSATIYQYAMLKQKQSIDTSVDAHLTDILNNLADDLANNGAITSTTVIAALVQSTRLLRPDEIRKNLEDRSLDVSGTKLPVANIDLFIDTDGDGMVNSQDPDDDNDGIPDELDPSPYVYSEAPVLIKPDVTNALPSKQEILFEWTSSDYAKNFEIQISKSADFATTVISQLTPTKTFAVTLEAGVYYIRARSENVYGFLGMWCSPKQLQVGMYTKSYGGSGNEYGKKIIQTSDSGYAIVGSTTSAQVHNGAVLLLRLDPMGTVMWKKVYDTAEYDLADNLVQTADGGFLLTSSTSMAGKQALWLIKTDSTGAEEWSSLIGGVVVSAFGTQILTESDGILIGSSLITTQSTGSSTTTNFTPYLIKIDLQGNTLWSYTFDETSVNFENFIHLHRATNGDYLFVGNYLPAGKLFQPEQRPFFARLSNNHSLFSANAFTNYSMPYASGATITSESNLLIMTANVMSLSKVDPSGNIIWSYTPNNAYLSSNYSPIVERQGLITYLGESYLGYGYNNIQLITLDKDGYEFRTRQYGSISNSYTHSDIIAVTDGGFAILGNWQSGSASSYDNEILLIKTDPEGNAVNTSTPLRIPLD